MIQININGKISIDAALKKYKYKYSKLQIIQELKERKNFKKKVYPEGTRLKKLNTYNLKKIKKGTNRSFFILNQLFI